MPEISPLIRLSTFMGRSLNVSRSTITQVRAGLLREQFSQRRKSPFMDGSSRGGVARLRPSTSNPLAMEAR